MGTEIRIQVPDNPDVVRQIGELIHQATLYGSSVTVNRTQDRPGPMGSLTAGDPIPPAPNGLIEEFASAAGDDPRPTPSGGNRAQRRAQARAS